MRLKLVCILGAILFIFMYMCSCVSKVGAESYSEDFDIKRVHYDGYSLAIYKVTTPNGSVYVARYGQGLCTLN